MLHLIKVWEVDVILWLIVVPNMKGYCNILTLILKQWFSKILVILIMANLIIPLWHVSRNYGLLVNIQMRNLVKHWSYWFNFLGRNWRFHELKLSLPLLINKLWIYRPIVINIKFVLCVWNNLMKTSGVYKSLNHLILKLI